MFVDMFSPSSAKHESVRGKARLTYLRALAVPPSSEDEDSVLQGEARRLAEKLCVVLKPYIDKLDELAQALYGQAPRCDWQPIFMDTFELIVQETALLKLSISDMKETECKHEFVWPAHGANLDLNKMRPKHQPRQLEGQQVAFTMFPGVTVQSLDGIELVTTFAEVITCAAPSPHMGLVQ